ncbi:MAG: hypothetical protein EPO22_09615 [Dehalococcoidia bacterium]|nr:MAG: hypothetical protein EPO22_09615 [Dehalococcoidia bacterium]
MNDDEGTSDAPPERRRFGCLAPLAVAIIVVVAAVVAIGFLFDQGSGSVRRERGYDAGAADGYENASVVYAEAQHLFVTRLEDGTFIALYDKSPKQQELRSDCRVAFDDTAALNKIAPLPGIVGAFVENCDGLRAVWRADGVFAFGAGYGNLDRFNTSVDVAGHLIVDTSSRTCTRSRGVIGVPPFDERTCGSGD